MRATSKNAYSATSNPGGIINLGVAENSLMTAELDARLTFPFSGVADLPYGSFRGSRKLRQGVADLFNRRRALGPRRQLAHANVAIANGAGSLVAAVAAVVADAGAAVLVPAPVYGAFRKDLRAAAQVEPLFVNAGDSLPSVAALDNARRSASRTVRALLITNPGNPTGKVVPRALLLAWIKWAQSHQLHCIVDEVYLFSIWGQDTDFVSALELEDVNDQLIHVIWSFSKDFCLNGFRVGALISRNQELLNAYNELSYFHGISSVIDNCLVNLLEDTEFVDTFMATNLERLRVNFAHAESILNVNEIPFLKPNSAFFLWIDLAKYTERPSIAAEALATNTSASLVLFQRFLKAGVYVAPSEAFFCDPIGLDKSRFRINVPVPKDTLELGLNRLLNVLSEI
ncbi:pyridoxal phosphate-dependent transferase [Obelidium mucronatum]|nr:pyridoxal phosphate-dependent transferase [Obelidium mucronatum]